MEHSFETPHPSIQTQDQIFKLPSSQPRYSPNLSPVPTTRSKNLKENRVSTPWTENTSKTLTSGGRSTSVSSSHSSSSRKSKSKELQIPIKKSLKASMKPRSSKPRNSKLGSRSGIGMAGALASPFVSRPSSPVDGQESNSNSNNHLPPKPRRGNRGLSDTFYNPNLPSPRSQTHVTESLHEREKGRVHHAQSAHTSPSSKAPPSVLLDLNTQLKQKKRKGGHRGTVSVDGTGAVAGYPQVLGGTTTQIKHEGPQRERRISAPSSYSRRTRPHALPLLVGAPVGLASTKTRRSRLPSGLKIIHNVNNDGAASTGAGVFTTAGSANHTDDDGFVLPLPYLHNKDPTTATNSTESNMEMDWGVGIVDFNRPPSQMCHYPTTTTLSDWVGGDVFSSSESEGSSSEGDDDDEGIEGIQTMANPTRASRTRTRTAHPLASGSRSMDDPFGFGSVLPDLDQSMFGDDAWGISTPLKTQIQMQTREGKQSKATMMMKATSTSDLRSKNHDGGLVRVRSLPVMHSMGIVGEGWMELKDYDQEDDTNEGEDEDPDEQEQDMDLTNPLISDNVDTGAASTTLGSPEVIQLADRRGDITPWILDSLISPPSRFLNTQEEIGREYPDGKEESVQDQGAGNLSSKTLLSSSSSSEHNLLSSPFRLSSDDYISKPGTTNSTTSAAAGATATTSFTAKRTRSGTIVPFSHCISNNTNTNDPPGTRRTRSGTLVGPLPLPLAASGSGVRRTRERSGTISAGSSPLPLPVGIGAKRTRSGTVIGCAPPPISLSAPASGSVPGGNLTKEREPGPEILEQDHLSTTSNSKSGRAAGHHSGFNYNENLDGSDIEVDMDGYVGVEPHIDALYIPRQSSSPDPIDFLRLAHFQDYDGMREKHYRFGSEFGLTREEREDEDPDHGGTEERMEDEMVWCIADEPPSPIVVKNENRFEMMGRRYNKGGILSVGGVGYGCTKNGNNKRRRGKNAKGTTRMRFMIDGHEEQPYEVEVEPEEGEDSDDELLLGDRSTWDI